jgi:RNA polymerase sigma factor (TIGR02999 family)
MSDITQLLERWHAGDRDAESELFVLAMPELRRLARYLLKGEPQNQSVQATELIDEIYFRLVRSNDARAYQNRGHFVGFAGRCMRWHLTNAAINRRKRPISIPHDEVDEFFATASAKLDLVITVSRLLDELKDTNEDWRRLLEVKYFLGLSDKEAAKALGMPLRTMQRRWLDARAWLFARTEAAGAQ